MSLIRRHLLQIAGAALAAPAMPSIAWSQSYPARPVRVVVPVAAGGPSDVIARLIAQKASETWRQQIYIENVPAGAGNVGMGMVAKAAPDGYTILAPSSAFVVNSSLYARLAWDPLKDFAPISLAAASPHVMVVHPSLPASNAKELVALVKANPGKYSYASPGAGTTGQLSGELFKLSLGLDLLHVPFNGATPAITSTIGGHTPILFCALPAATSNIKDGKLRALAVTSGKRVQALPDVPTMAEAGFADQESLFVQAILAPAGTPREIVDLWYREIARAVGLPEVKDRLTAIGFEAVANTPDEFGAWLKVEVVRWGQIIRDAGIKKID